MEMKKLHEFEFLNARNRASEAEAFNNELLCHKGEKGWGQKHSDTALQ